MECLSTVKIFRYIFSKTDIYQNNLWCFEFNEDNLIIRIMIDEIFIFDWKISPKLFQIYNFYEEKSLIYYSHNYNILDYLNDFEENDIIALRGEDKCLQMVYNHKDIEMIYTFNNSKTTFTNIELPKFNNINSIYVSTFLWNKFHKDDIINIKLKDHYLILQNKKRSQNNNYIHIKNNLKISYSHIDEVNISLKAFYFNLMLKIIDVSSLSHPYIYMNITDPQKIPPLFYYKDEFHIYQIYISPIS